jgi:lipoprotein-anchoring transpeptidase ErfK/SrfK
MLTFCVAFVLACAAEFAPERPGSIVVDLSDQMLYVYSEVGFVQAFEVSTGAPRMETPIGEFSVESVRAKADLSSRFGYVPDVPWIIEFSPPYYIHGAPWWLQPAGVALSHGCVNMRVEDAEWLWHWVLIEDLDGYGTHVSIRP